MLARFFKKSQDWAPLLLRLMLGVVFIYHGYPKIMGLDATASFLAGMNFPAPEFLAVVLAVVEFIGGIFLVLGVFTRYVAMALAITMLVAIFVVHFSSGFDASKGGFEYTATLFIISAALMILGSGKFSLEKTLFQKEL